MKIHYLDYWTLGINPHVLCKDRPQNFENIGKKENWVDVHGTWKKSEVTCKDCLKILNNRPFGFYFKRRWQRWRLPKKEFCERYGHWYDFPSSYTGNVIGKGIYATRYVYTCLHCNNTYHEDVKISEFDVTKRGHSFGSEGTCAHCTNSGDCSRTPWRPDDPTRQQAFVYTYCPINKFKPHDEQGWKKQMRDLGDLMQC